MCGSRCWPEGGRVVCLASRPLVDKRDDERPLQAAGISNHSCFVPSLSDSWLVLIVLIGLAQCTKLPWFRYPFRTILGPAQNTRIGFQYA